jgi:hypothetical protein
MPVPVPVRAELVPSPALDQAEEVGDQVRAWDWVGRLVRHRSVQLLVARIPPEKIEYSKSWLEPKLSRTMSRAATASWRLDYGDCQDFYLYVEVLFRSDTSDRTGNAIYSTSRLATSLHLGE